MTRQRHKARIVALQGLYQLDMQRTASDADIGDMIAPILVEAELSGDAADYARELAAGTWAKHERYDQMIAGVADHWDISRMAVVDRNTIRLALYELVEQPDVPARVVIDEAIEIGREFGSAETPHFINGVLDAIWKTQEACRIARGSGDTTSVSSAAKNHRSEQRHGTV